MVLCCWWENTLRLFYFLDMKVKTFRGEKGPDVLSLLGNKLNTERMTKKEKANMAKLYRLWDYTRANSTIVVFSFLKKILFIYFQREVKGGRERGRHINVGLPLMCPQLGTWPATQACALTGSLTGDPLVCRPAINPLSHTSQGYCGILFCLKSFIIKKKLKI